jgi:hypothetical protein
VIFVADSSPEQMEANREALVALQADLEVLGLAADIPVVFQYNKRDLPDAVSEEELNQAVNPHGAPAYAAVATRRQGIIEPVTAVSEQVVRALA